MNWLWFQAGNLLAVQPQVWQTSRFNALPSSLTALSSPGLFLGSRCALSSPGFSLVQFCDVSTLRLCFVHLPHLVGLSIQQKITHKITTKIPPSSYLKACFFDHFPLAHHKVSLLFSSHTSSLPSWHKLNIASIDGRNSPRQGHKRD